jgi:hypothetical protein
MNKLKSVVSLVMALVMVTIVWGQKPHFIYFQTEDNSPFFVQLNKKNYSSSSVGHVVLSGITNGTYDVKIGYPGQNTLQEYRIEIENKDLGFLVKKSVGNPENAIVNLQTQAVQLSGAAKREADELAKQMELAAAEAKRIEEEKALADAKRIQDEKATAEAKRVEEEKAVAEAKRIAEEKAVVEAKRVADEKAAAEAQKQETTNAGVATAATVTGVTAQTVVKEKNEGGNAATKETKEVPQEVAKKNGEGVQGVQSTNSTPQGIAVDAATKTSGNAGAAVAGGTLSAAEIARLQEEARKIDARGKRDSVLAAEKKKTAGQKTAPAFLDLEVTMPESEGNAIKQDSLINGSLTPRAEKVDSLVQPVVQAAAVQSNPSKDQEFKNKEAATVAPVVSDSKQAVSAANANCKGDATDADIELVSMIVKGERDPDEAINIIKKTVKVKCITTAQARKLTVLFEQDEHRYAMLDIAYRYTSDRQNFSSLADLLKDAYYVNRFKAMLQ